MPEKNDVQNSERPTSSMGHQNQQKDNILGPDGILAVTKSGDEKQSHVTSDKFHLWTQSRLHAIITYVPARCRYNPDEPPKFSLWMNLLFGFAGCFTVANLYYSQPILNLFAHDFHITDEQASYIPTLAQAGYAVGLFFLNPLGDFLKRRGFVLWLVFITATFWIGLCLTHFYTAFEVLTFITGITTVTPQIMTPLVADLAPPEKRGTALSIVISGLLLGILIARLLSGIAANFIGWRSIYWISLGLQYFIFVLLWFVMPDYPSTNPDTNILRHYPLALWDILVLFFSYPILAQSCLIGFFTSATFTGFWTTLTFLLAGKPYDYSTLVIGLFALIGIGSMSWGPAFARLYMDKHHPNASVLIGNLILLAGILVGTFLGSHNLAGPIIQAFLLDIGVQTSQIANRKAIFEVEPKKRNRVNTAYMLAIFAGQLTGTGVGNALYARGGWMRSGYCMIGFCGAAIVVLALRGPWEETRTWVGWKGGVKKRKEERDHDEKVDRGSASSAPPELVTRS